MAAGDCYIRLFSGQVDFLSGVTATPTVVPQSLMDAYYRDEGTSNAILAGPDGFVTEAIVDTDATAGTITPTSGLTDISTLLNDLDLHIPPRQLEYELSYWEFQVGTLSYFYRWDSVVGWANNPPPNF